MYGTIMKSAAGPDGVMQPGRPGGQEWEEETLGLQTDKSAVLIPCEWFECGPIWSRSWSYCWKLQAEEQLCDEMPRVGGVGARGGPGFVGVRGGGFVFLACPIIKSR